MRQNGEQASGRLTVPAYRTPPPMEYDACSGCAVPARQAGAALVAGADAVVMAGRRMPLHRVGPKWRHRVRGTLEKKGTTMTGFVRKTIVSVFLGSAVVVGMASPASAATQTQDGLVNVAVGDITITDAVDLGVAAQIAANICGVKVGPVAVLATQVDRSGESRTVCTTDQGPITLTNNN